MYIFQRRRQFFGKGVTYITFYGNGGITATGDVVVILAVPKGAQWKDVIKPEFLQAATAKKQNGFTLVADDDNTVVTSDFIITGDMEVWASYTVVEIGVITARGEVMSVESWIKTYGNVCWNYDHISWNLVEEHRLDLVHFVYFKDGDNSFAISVKYNSPSLSVDASSNKEFGGMGVLLSSVPSFNIRTLKNQYSYIVKKYAMFDPSSPDFSTTDNLGVQPWMLDMMRQYKDGKAYSYNYFTELGDACPIMAEISQWNVFPTIEANSFYVAMPEQIQAVFRNKSKVLSVVEQLEEWEMNLTGTSNRYMYGFRPENSTFEGGFLSIKYYLTNYVNDFIIPIQYTTGYYDMDSHIVSETYNDHLALYSPVLEDISYTTYQGISTFNTIPKDYIGDLPAKLIVCDVNHLF